MGIFGQGSEEYFDFAVKYIRIFMFMTFVNGMQPLVSIYFTAIGKTKMGVFMSLIRQIVVLIPLMVIFPIYMGIDGVLYSGPIADGLAAVFAIILIICEMQKLKAAEKNLQAKSFENLKIC